MTPATAPDASRHVVRSADLPWQTYRDVRLRALETNPEAFRSTFAQELKLDESTWAQLAGNPGTFVWIDAADEPSPTSQQAPRADGLVTVVPPHDDEKDEIAEHANVAADDVAVLVSMWVEPALRGGGAADELMEAALEYARKKTWKAVVLEVFSENARAAGLYLRHGFQRVASGAPNSEGTLDVYVLAL